MAPPPASPLQKKARPGGGILGSAHAPSSSSFWSSRANKSALAFVLFVIVVLAGRELIVQKVRHSQSSHAGAVHFYDSSVPALADSSGGFESEFEHAFSSTPVRYKSVTSESGRRYDNAVVEVQTRRVSHGMKIPLSVPVGRRLRVLITGGAGFVGSHLADRLLERGDEVIVIDNFFTGQKVNIAQHKDNPHFELIRHDVVEPILLEVDQIYHLACPASPVHYKYNPVKTIKTSVVGTLNMLGLAKRLQARFLLASTSEVYGDPLQHPQTETYWGNVNPIGERSCYDEGKRTAETLAMDYHRQDGVEVRIARIFNTYGPRMALEDGRVVSNFVSQAIRNEPITIHGDGSQTRSFQYVSDLVAGLMRLMDNDEHTGPFNIGNPGEFTMNELAEVVKEVVNPDAKVIYVDNTPDDPGRRRPDITKAKTLLAWEPKVPLREGLPMMVEDFKRRISEGEHHLGMANMLSRRHQAKREHQAAALGSKGGGGGGEGGAGGYKTEQADDR